MDYKKKLKMRITTYVVYIVIGLLMIVGGIISKTDNYFISPFGFALVVMGIARVRNYTRIMRNEDILKKREIAENDERNVSLSEKARSTAFSLVLLLMGIAVIVFSFLNMREFAYPLSLALCFLVVIYWICYLIYSKKF